MTPAKGTRLIAYRRCSTEEQEGSGLGLAAQLAAINRACEYEGYQLAGDEVAVVSGGVKSPPALRRAMDRVEAGEADGIIVSHLDRLYRSAGGFERIIEWAQNGGHAIVVLDPRIDTSEPMGLLIARIGMAFAELERGLISARTKRAMAVKRERGELMGRPQETDPEQRELILKLKAEGMTNNAIARELNERGLKRRKGAAWHHEQVRRVLSQARG